MSGAVAIAPPIASSLSIRKWANRPSQSAGGQRDVRSQPLIASSAAARPSATATRAEAGTTQSSGQRSHAIATNVSTANDGGERGPSRLLRSVADSLSAVAITSPAATAPMPRSAPATTGRRANSAYSAASASTITSGTAQHAGERGEGAAQAEVAVAEHQRQVDDVRPRQHLAERQHLDELLARQPALALDQLALRDRQHAAEALQGQAVEGEEQVGRSTPAAPARLRRPLDGGSLMRRDAPAPRRAHTLSAIAATSQARPTQLSGA